MLFWSIFDLVCLKIVLVIDMSVAETDRIHL